MEIIYDVKKEALKGFLFYILNIKQQLINTRSSVDEFYYSSTLFLGVKLFFQFLSTKALVNMLFLLYPMLLDQ